MGLNDLIVAMALRFSVSRFPWLSYVGSCNKKKEVIRTWFCRIHQVHVARTLQLFADAYQRHRPRCNHPRQICGRLGTVAINVRTEEYGVLLIATHLDELHLPPGLDLDGNVGKTAAVCLGDVY